MRKWWLAALLAATAVSVQAQDMARRGYGGVGAGVSKNDIEFCDTPGISCDDSGFAWNARAGYFFFPWLGIEGSYLDFGEATVPGVLLNPPPNTVPIPTDSDVRTFGFVASLVGRIPIGPVSLMGRVGWGAITAKFRGNAAVQDLTTGQVQYFQAQNRDTTGRFVYGAGIGFDFANAWTARIDWDRTKADDGVNPKYDVEMYTAGIAYRF
jgi:hypothetical protein